MSDLLQKLSEERATLIDLIMQGKPFARQIELVRASEREYRQDLAR